MDAHDTGGLDLDRMARDEEMADERDAYEAAQYKLGRPLESEAAMHRYETMRAIEVSRARTRGCMLGHDAKSLGLWMYPPIPAPAWEGIAQRLEICAEIVAPKLADEFAYCAKDARARAGGAA
jgi:hypothetical protein